MDAAEDFSVEVEQFLLCSVVDIDVLFVELLNGQVVGSAEWAIVAEEVPQVGFWELLRGPGEYGVQEGSLVEEGSFGDNSFDDGVEEAVVDGNGLFGAVARVAWEVRKADSLDLEASFHSCVENCIENLLDLVEFCNCAVVAIEPF